MKITIIEHSDFFVGTALFNKKMHLARFCFKKNDEVFVSDDELHRELGDDYISPCSQLTYEADRQAVKQRIFERRHPERILTTLIIKLAPGVAETLNLNFFYTKLILFYSFVKDMPSFFRAEFYFD